MDFNIPEINEIKKTVEEIKLCLTEPVLNKEWYTAEECWQLKGGGALSTFKSNRKYQCKGGIPDAYVSGRKVWSKESVLKWLKVTDDQIPEYLKACGENRNV